MSSIDLILIDDDELVRATWQAEAMELGDRLLVLATPQEIEDYDLDQETPIYIDLNLSDGVSGVDVARDLDSRGFRRLYLATGTPSAGEIPRFVKGITGKDYPLLLDLVY